MHLLPVNSSYHCYSLDICNWYRLLVCSVKDKVCGNCEALQLEAEATPNLNSVAAAVPEI